MLPAGGRRHRGYIIPQSVTHSLVLLKMGKIISRNMLSWLELLISRYCGIYLVVYIIRIRFFHHCWLKLHRKSSGDRTTCRLICSKLLSWETKCLLPNWKVRFLFQGRISCSLLTELNIIFLHVFNNNFYFWNMLQYFYVNKEKTLPWRKLHFYNREPLFLSLHRAFCYM